MALEIENSLIYLRALKQVPGRQLQAEARLTRKLQNLFSEVAERTLEEVLRRNRLPTDDVAMRLVLQHIFEAEGEYKDILGLEATQAARYGRNRVISELQRMGVGIGFTDFSRRVQELINEHVFTASQHTINRVVGDVMSNLAQSYKDGLGIDDAAVELRKVFQAMQDYELRRVARTEINSFQNEGAYLTENELGVRYHMWYTAEDERVRSEHVDLHGEIVPVGEPFSNGLYHPGDRAGDIKEWINCRCRLVPFQMPEGKMAPPGANHFRESDLVNIS